MVINTTMACLRQGQRGTERCFVGEMEKKIPLCLLACGKTVQNSLERKEVTAFLTNPPS